VGYAGGTFGLADLKGLHYLRYLVERPGADVDAVTLSRAVAGLAADVPGDGDMGEVLDSAALAAYRRRLKELDAELDAADRRGDQPGAARLNAERGALLTELRTATGLGGRQRRMGGSAERARVAVRKAIAATIARIEEHDPGVARLVRDRIHTGASCRYDPDPDHPVDWIIK